MVKVVKRDIYNRLLRLFALLAIICLTAALPAITFTAAADEVDVRLFSQDQTVHRGQTFEVDVNLSDNTGLITLFLTVKFDHSVFSLINAQQVRQALASMNMEHSGSGYDYIDDKTGGFNFIWDGGDTNHPDTSNGTILRLTFQSAITAPIGTYPIEFVADEKSTTSAYMVSANVEVVSPQITLIEGAYIVVWHDWDCTPINNTNIVGHPYNQLTGGYEYNSEESLNTQTDFPNAPSRTEDEMYSYEFVGWEGAVWRGDVPNDSSVIYYIAKYAYTPQVYSVWYYVDGLGDNNQPDGEIDEDGEIYTAKATAYNSTINDTDIPTKTDYTFYGWFTDPAFTRRLVSPLMPAKNVKLYGYFKYNIREVDIPAIQLVYRETTTNEELENIAYVDVYITKNYGLSSLQITLSEYDTENFTFCGFEKGEIFKQMSFLTTNYADGVYPENFNFSWNNSNVNSYELGRLLVLRFKIKPGAPWGAYEVVMTADTQNTTYVYNNEIWYSQVEFANAKIPIGETNRWIEPVPSTDVTIEVASSNYVPYNVELVVKVEKIEDVIENEILESVLSDNLMVYSLFDIYFQQNATKITAEQYAQLFGDKNVEVKIKLTTLQLACKRLDIYYVDDDSNLIRYESRVENGYLIFETNHFSHWALVGDYVLTNVETVSNKLLKISLIMFGIAASALIAISFVRSRKKQSLVEYSDNNKGGN